MRDLLNEIHWKDHVFTLTQFGVSLLLLLMATLFYFDKKGNFEDAQVHFESQGFTNEEAENFKSILQANIETYQLLLAHGDVGTPRRLQWLETLRRIGDRYQIPGIEFTLDGSELVQENMDPYWHPEVPLRATNMKLTLQLSHEGDLYRLLEGLRSEAEGLFSVESCQIRWLDTYSEEFELTRLRGECRLRWYTLADVTASWQQVSR